MRSCSSLQIKKFRQTDSDKESHPTDPSKKIVKFSQPQAVAPQHISIAVGPFEKVNFSEYRDQENEDAMAQMAKDVIGYCLPGREADLKNTCIFMPKVTNVTVVASGPRPLLTG
jgi:transcription initiation factor TFIID subunit 2